MAFAWAERVRQRGDSLEAENVQVAVSFWQEGRWRVRGHTLPDRAFAGYAYRVPAPEWFVRECPPEARVTPGSAFTALELRLHTTPLGSMCRNFEVGLALAQDKLAAALTPAVHLPDLLAGEGRLEREWKIERPAIAAQAANAKAAIERRGASWPPEIRQLRTWLHGAALRRLDAMATGREIFAPCAAYFGEPYLPCDLAPGLSLKAGVVRRAEFWPNAEGEARSRAWRADAGLVAAVEARLFPLWPAKVWSDQDFITAAAIWLGTAGLRDFEIHSPLPLFPHSVIFSDGGTPFGFRIRIQPETMRALGGSYLTLAAAGLSPYIAEPFYHYCAAASVR